MPHGRYWACAAIGAVFVPISTMLLPPAINTTLSTAQVSVLVFAAGAVENIEKARSLGCAVPDGCYISACGEANPAKYNSLSSLMSLQPTNTPPNTDLGTDIKGADPCHIMFSSGTTGEPKGIVVSQTTRAMYGFCMARDFRITSDSVILHSGSIVFNGCMLSFMPAFCTGATYVLMDKFEPEKVLQLIEHLRITHTMCVPTQIVSLLESKNMSIERCQSLQCVCSVGAPLLTVTRQKMMKLLPHRLYELYGLTEGICTVLDRDDAETKVKSVGRATAGNKPLP